MSAKPQFQRKPNPRASVRSEAEKFFRRLEADAPGRKLLSEIDQILEFRLSSKSSFRLAIEKGRASTLAGVGKPERFDLEDVIHFELDDDTLQKLMRGKIRFTDALIPTDPDGKDTILLLDCTLFKWSVLSWVGRVFRQAQLRAIRQAA